MITLYIGNPRNINRYLAEQNLLLDKHTFLEWQKGEHYSELNFNGLTTDVDWIITSQSMDVIKLFVNQARSDDKLIKVGRSARTSNKGELILIPFEITDTLKYMLEEGFEIR